MGQECHIINENLSKIIGIMIFIMVYFLFIISFFPFSTNYFHFLPNLQVVRQVVRQVAPPVYILYDRNRTDNVGFACVHFVQVGPLKVVYLKKWVRNVLEIFGNFWKKLARNCQNMEDLCKVHTYLLDFCEYCTNYLINGRQWTIKPAPASPIYIIVRADLTAF